MDDAPPRTPTIRHKSLPSPIAIAHQICRRSSSGLDSV
jgi:hypothetical protein